MGDGSEPAAQGSKWGDQISEERKRVLEGRIAAWAAVPEAERGERKGPFDNGPSKPGFELTGADVFWLSARALASREGKVKNDAAVAAAEDSLRDASRRASISDTLSLESLHLEGTVLKDVYLERAALWGIHLEDALLVDAHMEGALLVNAHLNQTYLGGAHLEKAALWGARLERANLPEAHLEHANLEHAQLQHANLVKAHLRGVNLYDAHLEHAKFGGARIEYANLSEAHLDRADLVLAHLEHADLGGAYLERANLYGAHLEHANLYDARLEHTNLTDAHLEHANLRYASLDGYTNLTGVWLGLARWWERFVPWSKPTTAELGDIHWGGVGSVDLTRIWDNWEGVERIGDERGMRWHDKAAKRANVVRAYRQLATQLRAQGMNEPADRFIYRAYTLNRGVLLRRALRNPLRLPTYLGSWILALLAGYGFRPGRTILCYLATLVAFTYAYVQVTHGLPLIPLWPDLMRFGTSSSISPLPWNEALVLSVSSFHGRGFFQPLKSLGDPVAGLAAIEAVIGLVIEISFIATFTQRFFGGH